MANQEFDRTALSFARLAYRGSLVRQLIFQRHPQGSEAKNDARGFPIQGTAAYTDIDPSYPIPCNFTVGQRRDVLVGNQVRTVTYFKVTIPRIYKSADGEWKPVDFSTNYRAHILEKNKFNLERFFQVAGEGSDLGPDITFEAIEVKDLI